MTILRQVGLLLVSVALMLLCVPYTGGIGLFTIAGVGGWVVSQYDDGFKVGK